MPELPEVERMRADLHASCVGKRVITVEAQDDAIVFESPTTADSFAIHLKGNKVIDTGRYGKCLYLIMEKAPHVILHMGMTGNVRIKDQPPMSFMDFSTDENWPPRFVKFEMTLDGGNAIAFADARRLGRVRLVDDVMKQPPISKLGFDPIHSMPSLEEFSQKVSKKRVPIKALLLDQSFSAGVGNWVADEVLHLSHIHPNEYTQDLTSDQIESIHKNMKFVCEEAIRHGADSSKFPSNWIFHHRWNNKKATENSQGQRIEFLTVGGRTSAYIPELQKLNNGAEFIPKPKKSKKIVSDDEAPKKRQKTTKRKKQDSDSD